MGTYREPEPLTLDDSTSNVARGFAILRSGAYVQIPLANLSFTTSQEYKIRYCKIIGVQFAIMTLPTDNNAFIEDLILQTGQPGDYVIQLNDGSLTIITNSEFDNLVK